MDHEAYKQLEEVKANIETLLKEARKGLAANAEHLFDDAGWYDKFVWKVVSDDDRYPNGITFLLVTKNEPEFEAWIDLRNTARSNVASIFVNVLRKLGMDWRCINGSRLYLSLDLDDEGATTVFPKLVKEGKIVIENDEELSKQIEQRIVQIEKEAAKKINSLRCLGHAIDAIAPF